MDKVFLLFLRGYKLTSHCQIPESNWLFSLPTHNNSWPISIFAFSSQTFGASTAKVNRTNQNRQTRRMQYPNAPLRRGAHHQTIKHQQGFTSTKSCSSQACYLFPRICLFKSGPPLLHLLHCVYLMISGLIHTVRALSRYPSFVPCCVCAPGWWNWFPIQSLFLATCAEAVNHF